MMRGIRIFVPPQQAEEPENLFLETGGIFLDGCLETDCRLYRAFSIYLGKNEDVSVFSSRDSLDFCEEWTR